MGKSFIPCKINGIDLKEKWEDVKHWAVNMASKDIYFSQNITLSDIKDIEYNEQEAIIRLNNGDFIALEKTKDYKLGNQVFEQDVF